MSLLQVSVIPLSFKHLVYNIFYQSIFNGMEYMNLEDIDKTLCHIEIESGIERLFHWPL